MLDKLIDIQKREQMQDGAFAQRLGVSRSGWNLIRRGKMPLSDAVAVRAVGAFPELTRDLLDRAESTSVRLANIRVSEDQERGAA